jgi:tetratricopeptide (TPR) repeat protein
MNHNHSSLNTIDFNKKAIELNPHDEHHYFNLANAYSELDMVDEEISVYKNAIIQFPNNTSFLLNLAFIYSSQRKHLLALDCYRKMIEIDPQNTMAYRNLGLCFTYQSTENEDKKRIMELLAQPDVSREDVMHGHFALGKMYQDCKQYEEAFFHYQEANAIHANRHSFKVRQYIEYVDYFINTFNHKFFKEHSFAGSPLSVPVFIIGLPRAGKTLVEHILSRHPLIQNKDELAGFERIAKKSLGQFDVKGYIAQNIKQFDKAFAEKVANEYLQLLHQNVKPNKLHIIDTTPTNFLFLGFAAMLFPNAKFIHCTRDPIDHCLSIYFKCFGKGNDYSYNLAKLGHYYLQYRRVMKHWQKTLKLKMLEIKYEDLIQYPDKTSRKIFSHVNMASDMTNFNATDLDEKPLTNHEIGYWKHYARHLELLQEILQKGGAI